MTDKQAEPDMLPPADMLYEYDDPDKYEYDAEAAMDAYYDAREREGTKELTAAELTALAGKPIGERVTFEFEGQTLWSWWTSSTEYITRNTEDLAMEDAAIAEPTDVAKADRLERRDDEPELGW